MSAVPFKANADRRNHIPKQQDRVTNWSEYDAALRQRGSLTVWFSEEAIAAWRAEPRTTRGGQPLYSAIAIATALTLRAVFRLALRQTEGLIGSVIHLLGLDLAIPDHSTLSRRAETLAVARPPSSAGPVHLLVDSTGLKLCGAGEWLVEKHGTSRRRSWRKLHIGVDADTGRIVAAALTTNDLDDGSQDADQHHDLAIHRAADLSDAGRWPLPQISVTLARAPRRGAAQCRACLRTHRIGIVRGACGRHVHLGALPAYRRLAGAGGKLAARRHYTGARH